METKREDDQPLQGMKILVADDEFLIAVNIEEAFHDAGAETVSAQTLAAALKGAEDGALSAAVLDIRLGRDTTEAVAERLAARGIPFVFYSGQALPDGMRAKYPNAKLLMKPARHSTFVEVISNIARR